MEAKSKKRHHYVPKAYLKAFCDREGKILVYRKDDPHKPLHLSLNNVALRNYYYSLPLPEGGHDNNILEDMFSELESQWPQLVDRLRQGDDINDSDSLSVLFSFIALQRLRVPAARDHAERIASEVIRSDLRGMKARGEISCEPDDLEIAPHPAISLSSITSMESTIRTVFKEMGWGVLHNKTDLPFLTSDNPVIWFDPSVPEDKMRPYVWLPGRPLLSIFPVAPDCVIHGHSNMRRQFASRGFSHMDLSDRKSVKTINRHICRFGYEMVLAQERGHEPLIAKYADKSPVSQILHWRNAEGEDILHAFVFGPREPKPRWKKTDP
ncbi:MAG: DUF4238 domain-containing protein [Alphaproteobacteria bacterium]|nr:DUF4238 domain-containing protein [Alphaproteobacteria bacterium]